MADETNGEATVLNRGSALRPVRWRYRLAEWLFPREEIFFALLVKVTTLEDAKANAMKHAVERAKELTFQIESNNILRQNLEHAIKKEQETAKQAEEARHSVVVSQDNVKYWATKAHQYEMELAKARATIAELQKGEDAKLWRQKYEIAEGQRASLDHQLGSTAKERDLFRERAKQFAHVAAISSQNCNTLQEQLSQALRTIELMKQQQSKRTKRKAKP